MVEMSIHNISLRIMFAIQIIGVKTIFGTISRTLSHNPININKKDIRNMYPIKLKPVYTHQRSSLNTIYIHVHLTMLLHLF
ncbi:hypothetical protein FKM82_005699 [Ascaphus truei]